MAIADVTDSQVMMEIGIIGRHGGGFLQEGNGRFAPVQHAQFVGGFG